MPAAKAWPLVRKTLETWRRTTIVAFEDRYLHARCETPLMRFVDDLELLLDADGKTVGVRSASRVGYSDLGTNRKRVEHLRADLRRRGIIR